MTAAAAVPTTTTTEPAATITTSAITPSISAGRRLLARIKEAIAYLKEKKNGGGNGSINNVEGYGYVSAPQAYIGHIFAEIPSSESDTGDFSNDTGSTHHISSDGSLLNNLVQPPLPFDSGVFETLKTSRKGERGDGDGDGDGDEDGDEDGVGVSDHADCARTRRC